MDKKTNRPSQTTLTQQLSAWQSHHLVSLKDSYQKLWLAPIQTMLTLLVVAIALTLPTLLSVGLTSLQQLSGEVQNQNQLSVFLKKNVSRAQAVSLTQGFNADKAIGSAVLIDADTGLKEFQQTAGISNLLEGLDENPLVHVITVLPVSHNASPNDVAILQEQLSAYPEVDEVSVDMEWLQKIASMVRLAEHIVIGLACLLALGVLLIVGNTIGLAIENRRAEIIVSKLVGATNSFIRRPFLYTGFFYGLGGGLLASLIVLLLLNGLSDPIAELSKHYGQSFGITGFNSGVIFTLLMLSSLLGWLGAWLAVSRRMRHIEPE